MIVPPGVCEGFCSVTKASRMLARGLCWKSFVTQ
jgi:hypothetical protein